jgi:hypothetical protein
MPSTFWRLSFTGKTVPPKGFDTRFHIIVRPTLPGRSVAPMTATVSGRKMASSGSRSYPSTSCAGSAFLRFFVTGISLYSRSLGAPWGGERFPGTLPFVARVFGSARERGHRPLVFQLPATSIP